MAGGPTHVFGTTLRALPNIAKLGRGGQGN